MDFFLIIYSSTWCGIVYLSLDCVACECLFITSCSPAYATPKLLDRTGLELSDIDVFEYHEAFAVSLKAASQYNAT